MLTPSPSVNLTNYNQYAVWLVAMIIVAFGFRYAREIIALVLDKLYQTFIQSNPV